MVWARQIEHQVQTILTRVEHVFGKDWDKTPEGEKLNRTGDELVKRLNPEGIYKAWLDDMLKRELAVKGKVFRISQGEDGQLKLEVSIRMLTNNVNSKQRGDVLNIGLASLVMMISQ